MNRKKEKRVFRCDVRPNNHAGGMVRDVSFEESAVSEIRDAGLVANMRHGLKALCIAKGWEIPYDCTVKCVHSKSWKKRSRKSGQWVRIAHVETGEFRYGGSLLNVSGEEKAR